MSSSSSSFAPRRPSFSLMTSNPRPNLLPTAAFVSLLVLALGVTGLFALSYTNTQTNAALVRLQDFNAAHVAAISAQVSFKTQVQEWKNILLRGHDSKDRAEYLERFTARENDVQRALRSAADLFTELGVTGSADLRGLAPATLAELVADHKALGERYRAELSRRALNQPGAAADTDRAVRGVDRPLNDAIDQLAKAAGLAAASEQEAFRSAAASRYASLRKATLIVGALAVVAAFALVFQASRAQRA